MLVTLDTLRADHVGAYGGDVATPHLGGGSRLFLWLHLFDPRDPYEPPEPYASRYAGRPYAGEVA